MLSTSRRVSHNCIDTNIIMSAVITPKNNNGATSHCVSLSDKSAKSADIEVPR